MKRLILLSELQQKKVCTVELDGEEIVVVLSGESVHAFDGFCPHQGGPLFSGPCTKSDVRCPWHGCRFTLHDGLCVDTGSCKNLSKHDVFLKARPCKIVDGGVYLDE